MISVTGSGLCRLRVGAVGGGGLGDGAGAGSGYIQYQMISVAAGATVISAEVGTTAQPSAVSINGATILAKQGGDASNSGEGGSEATVAGDGYSGGGDNGIRDNCDGDGNCETFVFKGGFDGGDGEGPEGGAGTGEDVTQYTFTRWTLRYSNISTYL